jgi:capsular polysaccharide biosynthesis protein
LHSHAWQPWPVFWSHHKHARLVASSLAFMDDRKQICREAVYGDICVKDDPAWNYFLLPKPLWLEGNWTSLVSRWTPNDVVPPFTHWILDALPRLAMLSEFPSDTRILVPGRLAGYQKETLALLGLTERCRHTPERHIVVENYYFASPTAMIDCYNPFGVNFLRSQFLPKADPLYVGPKKFVIRRSSKARRGIQNEEEFHKFFTDLGWGILDTEKLTFAQEIKLFNEAEAIAGVFGSGFTNAVWCKKGCKLLPFVPDNWLDGYVEWIASTLGLEFHYRIFPSDHAMRARIDLATVKEMLRAARLHP